MKMKFGHIVYYIVISFLFYGCTMKQQDKLKSLDVDCSNCKVKMMIDDNSNHNFLDVKQP